MATSFDTTLANLGIGRTVSGPAVKPAGAESLGQGDFLTLMTAQLKNQDPFDPVDNTQMVGQMAQFSTLAGQTEMNSTLKAIADKLGATSASDALAYVGRNVLTEGATAYPRTTGGLAGAVELDKAATELSVTVKNANGTTLRTLDLGAQPAGTAAFDWDGTTDSGDAAGDGPFTLTVSARDGDGAVDARTLVWAPVATVSTASGSPVLTLPGLGQVPVSAVRSVG